MAQTYLLDQDVPNHAWRQAHTIMERERQGWSSLSHQPTMRPDLAFNRIAKLTLQDGQHRSGLQRREGVGHPTNLECGHCCPGRRAAVKRYRCSDGPASTALLSLGRWCHVSSQT